MTARATAGGHALLLGGAVLAGAVAFGSRALGVVALGLLVAAGAARAWAALARTGARASFSVEPSPATEGDEVRVRVEVERATRVPTGPAAVRLSLGRFGAVDGCIRRSRGEISLGKLPRGCFPVESATVELRDPLGLEPVSLALEPPAPVLVYPRLVELETLFGDAGVLAADGRRLLTRRPAGFDLHSVRDYEQGESLRRVHWPTTARRGRLMVKELEDSPEDAIAVVLDCDPAGAFGRPPDSSFETAVRAAGSLLLAHVSRGRRAALVTTRGTSCAVSCRDADGGLRAALATLAAVEADTPRGLARVLGDASGAAARAGELVLVTPGLEPGAVERALDLCARGRVSVVWVDAPSWSGRATRTAPWALRLAAAGVPLAVLRQGDDLAEALQAPRQEARANG